MGYRNGGCCPLYLLSGCTAGPMFHYSCEEKIKVLVENSKSKSKFGHIVRGYS